MIVNTTASPFRLTIACWLAIACGSYAFAGAGPADDTAAGPPADTLDVERLLEIIDVGPYEVPDLSLRKDHNYAYSAVDVEPFRHVTPFKEHFLEQMEYTGPGRAIAEPQDLDTVKIGFIGPIMGTVSVATGGKSHEESLGIPMLRGAQLAIEQANQRGGYAERGIPFELVISNDNGLWGASGNEIVKLAYRDRVWAILGTVDGANSHIAIRVALKAEITMMNSGDTDPTFIETNIPWVFRCIGDDRQMGYLLVDYLYRKLGHTRVGIIRASNRYGRFGVREIKDGSRRLGHPVILEMAYQVGSTDFALQLDRLAAGDVEAVVHWGDAVEGALILNEMRARGMEQPYYACDRCVSDEFLHIAGDNAEGVVCGYPWDPTRQDTDYLAFAEAYRRRFGLDPDTYSAHAYDGMSMLIWAIQTAGLNRAKVRDVLAHRASAYRGVTGEIPFSACLDDLGEVFLARVEDGAWRFHSRQDLDIPRGTIAPRDRASRKTAAAPEDVTEVKIGWFGPTDPNHPTAGQMWQAATLAVEEANADGGCGGLPVRLVSSWSANPWGTGVADLTRLVYDEGVWAVIGAPDGASAHLVEQVVAKARLPFVNPTSTDQTANQANVSWIFSCAPGGDVQAQVLAQAVSSRTAGGQFAVVSCTDHDSRMFTADLLAALKRLGAFPTRHLEFQPENADFGAQLEALHEAHAVVVVANPDDSARFVRTMRSAGSHMAVFGGPAMGTRRFLDTVGRAGANAEFPLLWHESAAGERSLDFARRFRVCYGHEPDYTAACAYDGVCMLVEAIRRAGLDRAGIGDALRSVSPWAGVSGTINWDDAGRNNRPVSVGTIRDERIVRR